MKIFLLCNSQSNQVALANKIFREFQIDKIHIWEKKEKKLFFYSIKNLIAHIFTFFKFRNSWINMLNYYGKIYKEFPLKPSLILNDVNSTEYKEIIKKDKPDLVLVSGTNLLKKELIELINMNGKVMNLHTGISPYVKGGPNCTNWCLFMRKFHLIGNTVHWIDEGIDSGDIIATEKADLNGKETLNTLHIKVMESAHLLYIKCIQSYIKNKKINSINQNNFVESKLFKTKDWKFYNMFIALLNFYFYYNDKQLKKNNLSLVKPSN